MTMIGHEREHDHDDDRTRTGGFDVPPNAHALYLSHVLYLNRPPGPTPTLATTTSHLDSAR